MTLYPSTVNQSNDIEDPLEQEPSTSGDVNAGGAIGAVGGAVVGGLAGGPIGAVAGAIIGGLASAAAIDVVDREDSDYSPITETGSPLEKELATPAAAVNTYTGADYRGIDDVNYEVHPGTSKT